MTHDKREVQHPYTKEAAGGRQFGVDDGLRREASLSHLARIATERRSRATAQWVSEHVRPERRYRPPAGTGLRRKALRKEKKSVASRYYQLLSGHAATASFLNERMMGHLCLESNECRWCGSRARESRHHLFVECKAWYLQQQRLWRRIGKDCGWQHPKALAVRKLWKEKATEAVLEFLRDTWVGCWSSGGRGPRRERERGGKRARQEEGLGPPGDVENV